LYICTIEREKPGRLNKYISIMTHEEFYRKTDECIARFKNGKERYKTSATFNRVVQMLVRDIDPYEIIDQLCQMSDDQVKAFEQYAHRDTRPITMP
jgi:hypothetical protein